MGPGRRTGAQHPLMRCLPGLRRSGSRRTGSAAAETVLPAPLILAVIWLLFFFGGGLLHKQKTIVTARSGTWSHARVFGEVPHGHNVFVNPEDWNENRIIWTGDGWYDEFIASNWHMRPATNPLPQAVGGEPAGGVAEFGARVQIASGGSGAVNAMFATAVPGLNSVDPDVTAGTETWAVTATFDTRMTRYLGGNINRTITADLRMDCGCWTQAATNYRRQLGTVGTATAQHVLVNTTVQRLAGDRLVSPQVAARFAALSVLR